MLFSHNLATSFQWKMIEKPAVPLRSDIQLRVDPLKSLQLNCISLTFANHPAIIIDCDYFDTFLKKSF